ncbi:hypothetical protein [Wolbachia endosymbiont of Ctenocephalides felis wCfeT]|uniref:hypothetical protein n=1 Tax=Wolbachia endosymbiont of Ctenocephalides felis wCfeT TaxID=2732593 RepID=UPI001445B67D|nr:hypothetical protein [Wolbachia endosymbiont of Ctenocephalides felis wCfeT]
MLDKIKKISIIITLVYLVIKMHIGTSEKSSKILMCGVKLFVNQRNNHLISLENISSAKKLTKAFLLVLIVPFTVLTLTAFFLCQSFINAVSAKDNDSKLSKVIKSILRFLFYIIAVAIIVPCFLLNVTISLVPGLIFMAINNPNVANTEVENEEATKTKINNKEEYSKRVEEEVDNLRQQKNADLDHQSSTNYTSHPLVRNNQQPTVEVISRVDNECANGVDQIIILRNINGDGLQNGEMIMRTEGDDNNVTARSVFTGDVNNGAYAAGGFILSCHTTQDGKGKVNGIDLNFDYRVRTGADRRSAMDTLMQSASARNFLPSSNATAPSIKHLRSSTQELSND